MGMKEDRRVGRKEEKAGLNGRRVVSVKDWQM